ncbi:MAG: LytR C-terminal domain-containing protein [Candidatus Magasanikbacteria bacterium]|nr:LytR C-terminal domain-containing protein [Candidatus Magasanikbacteria bacterium]
MVRFFLRIINIICNDFKEHIVKTGIAITILITVYLLSGNIFLSFIIGLAIAILLLGWDSRVFVGLGLIFLITCPFLLAYEKKSLAEEMAVYAYYMLALGVVLQIVQHFKDSIFSKDKTEIVTITKPMELWDRKKIIRFSIGAVFLVLFVFVGCLSFFYLKMEKRIRVNDKLISDLVDSRLEGANLAKEKIGTDQLLSTDSSYQNIETNWDSAKVIVQYTTDQVSLAGILAEKFRKIGTPNVDIRQIDSVPSQFTSLQYCSTCANIVMELLAALPNSSGLDNREDRSLTDEIIITLGEDQILITNSEISISILNGTAASGLARKLQADMQGQGFVVSQIGDADKKDYQTTIIKYSVNNLAKANIVKDYLALSYNNLEMLEDPNLPTDIEIVLGRS